MLFTVRTRPLSQIVRFYRTFGGRQEPMAALAEQLERAAYGAAVYAATSHATLLLAPTPEFEWDTGVLRVTLDGDQVVLVYAESPFISRRWTRRVPAADAFAAVERFVRDRRWLVEYRDSVG
jgi:hypothetical protein